MDKIKLFCFPFAGGSATIYTSWKKKLHHFIELHPVELAGRGKRFTEPFYNSLDEAVDDLFNKIINEINKGKYALFGHSMGGLIVYEIANKLRNNNLNPPVHIFFGGSSAPSVPLRDDQIHHHLPDKQFIEKIVELGGTPPGFFEQNELVDLFIPLLKNDFKISETDISHKTIIPFDFNISIFIGSHEDITDTEVLSWKNHTNKKCQIHYIEGGHFFINENKDSVIEIINNTLIEYK